ncbi:MAG: polymer-forming cytoskeletal protein [Bacteroidota bacterium]
MPKHRNDAPGTPGQVNIIGPGTVIEGGLKANSDVRVSGKVIGNINVDGKTVVTPEGTVEGEVRSAHADIAGRVEGEVFISERLVLKSSAVVDGNIHTVKLVIEDGATFSGTCNMGGALPKRSRDLPGVTVTEGRKDAAPQDKRASQPAGQP